MTRLWLCLAAFSAFMLFGCASPKPQPTYCPMTKTIWDCLEGKGQ